MLGPYGETLVVDWGLAKIVEAPSEPCRTRRRGREQRASGAKGVDSGDSSVRHTPTDATEFGTVTGTPAYMSPEQRWAGNWILITPASDV